MKTLHIHTPGGAYDICMDGGLLARAGALCRALLPRCARLAVVTDATVAPLYAKPFCAGLREAGFDICLIVVPAGERAKSLPMLTGLYDKMLSFGMTRSDAVVALGGGVVGDLAGFAAATLLRGVDLIQVPTTLLAQVDSSVGGKVAVNVPAGKNLVGAFWQPRLVLMDSDCLHTLTDADFASGMAEVIKYGCIADAQLFAFLEQNPTRAAVMDEAESIVHRCCELKRQVVEVDERDNGARMTLNFGHTLGHAYELAGGYETWTHGQAVAAGMCRAAALGEVLGVTPAGTSARIAALVAQFGLPTAIDCTAEQYAAAIGLDKKGQGDEITLILPAPLGRAVRHPMPKAELLALLTGGGL